MWQFITGKKTYISAACLALFALFGWYKKLISGEQAMIYLSQAGGLVGIRHSITTTALDADKAPSSKDE